MKNLKFILIVMVSLSIISVIGVNLLTASKHTESDETLIVASFYPMYIAGLNLLDGVDNVRLDNLSEPQTGCLHDYTLTTEDMKLLSKADVFMVNGGGIETFLTEVADEYPSLVQLDASSLIKKEDLGAEDNSHYWMSVELYSLQISALESGLCDYFSKNGDNSSAVDTIHENAEKYISSLEELSAQQEVLKNSLAGSKVILFHEAYEYVADDYGMDVVYLMDLDEEREISAGEVADVMDELHQNDVKLVLAEEEYGSEMGSQVEQETDADVIYLDTIVRGTTQDDKDAYLDRMSSNIALISEYASKQNQPE